MTRPHRTGRDSGSLDRRIGYGEALVLGQVPDFARQFGQVASKWKRDGSRLTEADLAISRSLQEGLAKTFPEDSFLSEEQDENQGPVEVDAEFAWLADPIDGTNNFARGIPSCGISLALLRHGEPIYGYVYDHSRQRLLQGGSGRGCRIGDRRVEPAATRPSAQSIVGAQTADGERAGCELERIQRLCKVRALGSSSLHIAYAATGVFDTAVEWAIKPWDVAAGFAMLKATPGRVIHYMGDPVFPLRVFDTRAPAFGYIAGDERMVSFILKALGQAAGSGGDF